MGKTRQQRSNAAITISRRRGALAVKAVAGLACLLLAGCDRTALEQAFAPDPQLVDDAPGQASNANSGGQSQTQTASGGSAPGGGTGLRLPGQKVNGNQPSPANKETKPDDDVKGKPSAAGNNSEKDSAKAGKDGDATSTVASPDKRTANDKDTSNLSSEGAPAELQDKVEEVLALGVLTSPDQATVGAGFKANEPVTREEFARWLMSANNVVHGDRTALQVRSASSSSMAVFKDVPTTHPDFSAIQGLAEAGIILSSLSGAQEQINFKPDAPLSREDMLLWKVPLDVREALPSSNLEAVKEAWGFQDASKVSGPALRAVLADYSNGDQAVIRRVFGYTTLLQPQKPVTQAEAAAALWYFGSGGQGISAGDVQVGG